jgi:hypothetical protein
VDAGYDCFAPLGIHLCKLRLRKVEEILCEIVQLSLVQSFWFLVERCGSRHGTLPSANTMLALDGGE